MKCKFRFLFISSILCSAFVNASMSLAQESTYPFSLKLINDGAEEYLQITNIANSQISLSQVILNDSKKCIFVSVNYEGNSNGLELKGAMPKQENQTLEIESKDSAVVQFQKSRCKTIYDVSLKLGSRVIKWKPDTESPKAVAAAELDDQKVIDDSLLAKICADAFDNLNARTAAESKIAGKNIDITMIASSYSKKENLLVGMKEDRMGALLIPYEIAIDGSEIAMPAGLKKESKFEVVGKILDGVLWGNVFEGCYFNMKATSVEIDGF